MKDKLGILTREKHGRLIDEVERCANAAGIAPGYVYEAVPDGMLGADELHWLKDFRKHDASSGARGVLYTGKKLSPPVVDRMAWITGVLTRNFVLARLFTAQSLGKLLETDEVEATCVLVHGFYTGKAHTAMERRHMGLLIEMLNKRVARRLQTVIQISDMAEFVADYGEQLGQTLDEKFVWVSK